MERSLESLQSEDILNDITPELTIGVAHAPYQRILNEFASLGAEVIFAGHTHGGQVCVPGYGALVTNCDIPRDQVKGLSTWQHGGHSAALNVSAGVGTSIYAPVRFACPPEATLITLTAREY
jgi:predicted MPP superfamily phosphohydrolase